ncbi:putative conserved hypothetical protein [Colletotrichum sublineola]|uniref:Uncharacterized protein n=1 Tax=Colletotrichum sublineola TaxID=1173701 RepID=A0A066X960_COLSU|nr:putative conserved hypothetical protein [Colletotrichum sublineola]
MTLFLTRLIVQTSSGTYWQTDVLSVLIKRITKIKLLLIDLQANSAIAVRAAEAVLSNVRESGHSQDAGREIDKEEECEEYMRMVNKFRVGLNSALRNVLMSMRFINRSGLPATAFEICAVAYETGFEGFKALLFQDRDLEYSATSDLDNMNTAHTAFNILNQTVMHLYNRNREQRRQEHPGGLNTTLELAYFGSENDQSGSSNIDLAGRSKCLQFNSMDEVITVMVSLATTSPSFLANFTNFRHIMALTGFIRDDVQPLEEGQFSAFFRMYTSQFDDNVERRDVLHLSEALRSGFFSRSSLVRSPDSQPKAQENAMHQLNELTKYMDDWVVDETCVTVPCPGYVWSVISIAVLFAAGGLGIGFSVGQRINGVDPSNLATYLWVVAAFIVLVGKSMKVKEWTWNDFLRRRVRCCSVSELQSITRIDAQLIIAKLLHDERRGSVLNIRGPYNSAFLRRSTEGFAIDEPISSSTLLLSGLTMLKVVTAKGHALVCPDFRRDTDLRVISHTPSP